MLADKCLEILGQNELESSGEGGEIIRARAKAVKGLVELVHGNIQSGSSNAAKEVSNYSIMCLLSVFLSPICLVLCS